MFDDKTTKPAGMPEDEIDDDRTIGGGVMGEGGTAIDRGTGTLSGTAQDPDGDEDGADGEAGSAALDLSEPDFGAAAADRALAHDD